MISVDDALGALFRLAPPLGVETVPLRAAAGRSLARPVHARRDQPPFPASAMDGYAVADDARPGARFEVVGEASAGARYMEAIGAGEAVRIFTGAPVPDGATRVVIQEDVRREGAWITVRENPDPGPYVRPPGIDFPANYVLSPPRRLGPSDLALLAAMDCAEVPVVRRPEVAILPTGDELVMPGGDPGPDQIVASNVFGLVAMAEMAGAEAHLLPIAPDSEAALNQSFDLAEGADLLVTIGGASAGDRDLVAGAACARGLELAFHKVAMRPGKPLMAGRLGKMMMLGLPGNPVSALVCGEIFLRPVLHAMLGLGRGPRHRAPELLGTDLPANGAREHYMRAGRTPDGLIPAESQDSALLSVLAGSDVLIVRAPHDPARRKGDPVDTIALRQP